MKVSITQAIHKNRRRLTAESVEVRKGKTKRDGQKEFKLTQFYPVEISQETGCACSAFLSVLCGEFSLSFMNKSANENPAGGWVN